MAMLGSVVFAADLESEGLYKKDLRDRRERIAKLPATISGEETFRRYFEAMKSGEFVKASQYIHDDALGSLKAKTLNALRDASRSRRAEFCKRADIKSIPILQHTPIHAFFEAVMRDEIGRAHV